MPILSSFIVVLLSQLVSVPAGTAVHARLESSVQTGTSKMGDAVVATVMEPIVVESKVIVPQGSRLNGRVETVEAATRQAEGHVRLVFRQIELPDGQRLGTWITNSFSASPPRRNRRSLIYTAVGGVAGAFVGGKTARVAGILGGSLIGFLIAGNSADGKLPDVTLRPGTMLHLELGEDLTLR
jgi:hypothetical protein